MSALQFETITGFDTWPVAFGADGNAIEPAQIDALLAAVSGGATDLLLLSHGWNNTAREASVLYSRLLGNLALQPAAPGPPRRIVVVRLYWPSIHPAAAALAGSGAAAAAADDDTAAQALVLAQVDALLADSEAPPQTPRARLRSQALQAMRSLLPRLQDDADAQADWVRLARLLVPASVNEEEEVLRTDFSASDGAALLQTMARPYRPPGAFDSGGAAVVRAHHGGDDDWVRGPEGAAGLGNLLRGALNGARNLLNVGTYYEMKERAGTIGRTGVADLLRRLRLARPGLRLHLCGHSFGARLVTAAVAFSPVQPDAQSGVRSLLLLQAAFSHNSFGRRFDGQRDGFFRAALLGHRLAGPLLITHTRKDKDVGHAYPLASRLRNQVASGLGDADDPYGALGRNGALFVPDALDPAEPPPATRYQRYAALLPGRIYNLEGAGFIRDHGDVAGREVAWALRQAIDATV